MAPPAAGGDPHCLVVTKLLPLPADSGGKLRTYALLRRLAANQPVTVVALDEGGGDVDALTALGIDVCTVPWARRPRDLARGLARARTVSSARFWSQPLADAVAAVAARHPEGRLVVEYAQLEAWARGAPARRRVVATHNVESALVRSYAETARGARRLALRAEAVALRRSERRLLRDADVVSVVSDRDRARLGRTSADVVVCPNGFEPGPPLAWGGEPRVAFVGHLGWAPNVDAAVWLAREVWPRVTAARPDAELDLVGRSPSRAVRALASEGIRVTGTVPSVTPYLATASVAVAPLRAAGGTRLKILEALAAGRPVVATTVGAEGLEDLVGRGILLADDPASMARVLVELLRDGCRARELGARGREAVRATYSWDSTLAPLLAACT